MESFQNLDGKLVRKTEMVVGFLFQPDSSVYLIRKNRPDWQMGKLNGIGGHVESNEFNYQAMHRECLEESNVIISRDSWKYICCMEGNDWLLHVFATILSNDDKPISVTDEKIELHTMESIINEKTIPNLKFLVPMAWEHLTNKYTYSTAKFIY